MSRSLNVHGTAVLLAAHGVLLRGPSGAGKSLLALALIESWQARGMPASLIADDRVDIDASGGSLIMRVPAMLAGLIELRGHGIVRRPFVAEARLALIVDLVDRLERMPEEAEFRTELFGLPLARCPVPRAGIIDLGHQVLLVREALHGPGKAQPGTAEKTT